MNGSWESDLTGKLAELDLLDIDDLKTLWIKAFRVPPPRNARKDFLNRAMAYHSQAHQLGGLRPATVRQLRRLLCGPAAAKSGPSNISPRLKPGTRLLREWQGTTHLVEVVEDGFLWKGKSFASLSAVAVAITGTRWSGPRFFGIGQAT